MEEVYELNNMSSEFGRQKQDFKEHTRIHSTESLDDGFLLSEESKRLKVTELARDLQVDENKLLRKIDIYVLLPFCFLYFVGNLGRSNVGLLWLTGLTTSLDITELQYYASIATFYIPYVIFQSFLNLILKSIRPHFWLSISILIYGCLIIAKGFVKNYAQFVAIQALHGLFESGVDSAVFYILSHYYERSESQARISFLYSFNILLVIFNNLVVYGLQIQDPDPALKNWLKLLVIDGCVTVFCAFVLFFVLPDFPEGIRFFSDTETLFIVKKLEVFTGKSGYNVEFGFRDVLKHLKDPLIFIPVILANFYGAVPTVYTYVEIIGFHYTGFLTTDGVLQSTWPWICGLGAINIFGLLSYYSKLRAPYVLFTICIGIIGISCIHFRENMNTVQDMVRYSGNFLVVVGTQSSYAIFIGWATFNVSGHLRKSILTSLMTCLYDFSGIYGIFTMYNNNIFLNKMTLVGLIFMIIALALSAAYWLVLVHENRKNRNPAYKEAFNMLSEREKILAGDKAPIYDYMY